jgi:hypothetical protein
MLNPYPLLSGFVIFSYGLEKFSETSATLSSWLYIELIIPFSQTVFKRVPD